MIYQTYRDWQQFDIPFEILNDELRQSSLELALTETPRGSGLWLFAYGSLMWHPGFDFEEVQRARLYGWHRNFCVWTVSARGSLKLPGLGLGLDHGGSCNGLAFRVPKECARVLLQSVWRREMLTGIYTPRWVRVRSNNGLFNALTFIVRRNHPQYAGHLDTEVVAFHIGTAIGENGPCLEYLRRTVSCLYELGVSDKRLRQLLDLADTAHRECSA